MSYPPPHLPVRRRPIPQFSSLEEFKSVASIPNAVRILVTLMGVIGLLGVITMAVAYLTREHPNRVVIAIPATIAFLIAFGFPRVGVRLLWRRLYARVMRGGGVMCDVYPAGFPDDKTAMLIDARLPDAQAVHVERAISRWLTWMASNPSASAPVGGLFADGPIRSADELVGPDGRGGFLVAGESDMGAGWRLVLPELQPRDPRRPYARGVVVRIRAVP